MANKYIAELFENSKLFYKDLLKLSKLSHSPEFTLKIDEIILKYFILDNPVNRVQVAFYATSHDEIIAPYSIHYGSIKNPKHLNLEDAELTIVIYGKMNKKQYNSIFDKIININSNPYLPKVNVPIQATGRSRGFSHIDDALIIYREKQTGKTIKEIASSKKLSINSENCSTLYYKIKKLIDNQSLEK